MNQKYLKSLVCLSGVALGFNCVAQSTIYTSFPKANGNAFSLASGQEIGNEIVLNPGATLNSISIEYYSPSATLSSSVGIDVTLYEQNGTAVNGFTTPGTELFNSGYYYGGSAGSLPTGYQVVTFTTSDFAAGALNGWAPNYALPTDLTLAVTFTGLDANDVVDLPLANTTPGTYGDYWVNNGSGWVLTSDSSTAGNLVMALDGTGTVPEPTTLGLAAIGGAALLGLNKLRRKR